MKVDEFPIGSKVKFIYENIMPHVPAMQQDNGKIGTVIAKTASGNYKVNINGANLNIHPSCLIPIKAFPTGSKVIFLYKDIYPHVPYMKKAADGKIGTVIGVSTDKHATSYYVNFTKELSLHINPDCLTLMPSDEYLIAFHLKLIKDNTIGTFIKAVLSITNPVEAIFFYYGGVAFLSTKGVTKPEKVMQSNIGWCFGEGMPIEQIEMWKNISGAFHPVFGTTMPSPKEAFEMGQLYAKQYQGLKESKEECKPFIREVEI